MKRKQNAMQQKKAKQHKRWPRNGGRSNWKRNFRRNVETCFLLRWKLTVTPLKNASQ